MIKRILQGSLLAVLFFWGCQSQSHLRVHQKHIQFDSTRARLSLEYMDQHYGIQKKKPTIKPRMVVVHWTAIPSFQETFDTFNGPRLPASREDIENASALNVSAHYLIKRNGQVYQLLPDTLFARHVIGLNYTAIGIENIGSQSNPLTDAQLKANTRLIRRLAKKYPIKYLIGHYEYTRFEDDPLWKEQDDDYRTEKIDPGKPFMNRLRNNLKELHLQGPPEQEAGR